MLLAGRRGEARPERDEAARRARAWFLGGAAAEPGTYPRVGRRGPGRPASPPAAGRARTEHRVMGTERPLFSWWHAGAEPAPRGRGGAAVAVSEEGCAALLAAGRAPAAEGASCGSVVGPAAPRVWH